MGRDSRTPSFRRQRIRRPKRALGESGRATGSPARGPCGRGHWRSRKGEHRLAADPDAPSPMSEPAPSPPSDEGPRAAATGPLRWRGRAGCSEPFLRPEHAGRSARGHRMPGGRSRAGALRPSDRPARETFQPERAASVVAGAGSAPRAPPRCAITRRMRRARRRGSPRGTASPLEAASFAGSGLRTEAAA